MSVPSVILKMRQVYRVQRFDPEAVQRLQRRRLRRLLQHVLTHSRFYAEYYRAHGIRDDRLDDIELKDVPTIDKQIVMENFDALACDPTITRAGVERFLHDCPVPQAKYRGRYHVVHTSGSTGSLGIFVYDRRAWDLIRALAGTRVLRYRPTVGRIRYAFLLKTDGHHAGVKLCQSAPGLAFQRLALSVDAPLDQMLRQVHHFQPHLLGGYGSALELLAQHQLAGRIRIRQIGRAHV
jgi:phenylacetate-coenzyme A ligase PaaK-like adenylate-forming protein